MYLTFPIPPACLQSKSQLISQPLPYFVLLGHPPDNIDSDTDNMEFTNIDEAGDDAIQVITNI